MKLSIITVVYNDAGGIESTIESVLSQQYDGLEYIIIDGGSTDGTMDVVSRYKEGIDTVVSEPDNGIYEAMNKGALLATGKYVLFMNSGDVFYADDVISRFTGSGPCEDLLYGDSVLRWPDGKEVFNKGDMDMLLKRMPFNHQACFVRLQVQNSLQFNLSFKVGADYDFVLRAHKQKCSFRQMDFVVSIHNMDGISNADPFLPSLEGLHALLNYDRAIDVRKTTYFAKHVVQRLVGVDDARLLEVLVSTMSDCRATSLLTNPLNKIQCSASLLLRFAQLYLSMSNRKV